MQVGTRDGESSLESSCMTVSSCRLSHVKNSNMEVDPFVAIDREGRKETRTL